MFGYTTIGELIKAIFKHCDTALYLKYVMPVVLFINTVFTFLFQSVGGIWFLIFLYAVDFLTGIAKAIYYSLKASRYKNKGLPVPEEIASKVLISKKFPRFLLTLFAALLLLTILNFAAIHSIVFTPLYGIFYAVFVAQNTISIAENLSELGLLNASILKKLKRKIGEFINSKD
ncbi:phage holin family protein [Belliella sp. DSM 111904]|uniref:Phage holin family protein n=1 Tax=Belliella filtrata TaxID=2923435 RepID=A0ABS9V428_9BACT|nr:phage holin family protein [Belliella filtrata]MCH7411164.1 phage holin family protein [Belliella filtrata]